MSSDERGSDVSDNEQQNNEILEIGEDLQDSDVDNEQQTEEVQKDETAENEGEGQEDGEKKNVKPKRTVRNPQPKLNAQTLKGSRGIAALENYFQRVKFKGKGYEHQDLDVIMKTYEYWCHRLFPKFPFDTCIERLEALGSKRPTQTHIKRIRFDLLVDDDKPILDHSDEEPNVDGFVNIQSDEINQQQNQQFDQLLGSSVPAPAPTPELTEEQMERIRLNKERAERLRQERLRKIREKAGESLQESSQVPETSGLQNETRMEQLEGSQSDIFTQEDDYDSTLDSNTKGRQDDVNHSEALFNHESNLKGKTSVTGIRLKKKSSKMIALSSDSEKSDVEDTNHGNGNEDVAMSDENFTLKKRNTIIYGANEQSTKGEFNEHLEENSEFEETEKQSNNFNGSDQEISTNQMDISDYNHSNSSSQTSGSSKIDKKIPDNLVAVTPCEKVAAMDAVFDDEEEPMEVVVDKVESDLKSTQTRDSMHTLKNNSENKENSPEDNVV